MVQLVELFTFSIIFSNGNLFNFFIVLSSISAIAVIRPSYINCFVFMSVLGIGRQ